MTFFGGTTKLKIFRGSLKLPQAIGASMGLILAMVGLMRPFWTCHSSGNQVDGLPLALNCRHSRRATIRTIGPQNLMIDETYQGKSLGNL